MCRCKAINLLIQTLKMELELTQEIADSTERCLLHHTSYLVHKKERASQAIPGCQSQALPWLTSAQLSLRALTWLLEQLAQLRKAQVGGDSSELGWGVARARVTGPQLCRECGFSGLKKKVTIVKDDAQVKHR